MEKLEETHFPTGDFMVDVVNEMQERRRLSQVFLNGRDPHSLSDEEFDKLQEISGNNCFDKRNPEHVQIMENRKIFGLREDYLKTANDRTKIGKKDTEFGLNIRVINHTASALSELARRWMDDDFCQTLVNNTVFIHDRRKLQIPQEHGGIIAEPDEPDMTEASMNIRGVLYWGRYAYDLTLDVTLDLREFNDEFMKDIFSFYFALKLSQVNFSLIDNFLNYQLTETFLGNFNPFSRFLTLMMREAITIPHKNSNEDTYFDKKILDSERVKSVEEWIENYKLGITNLTFIATSTNETNDHVIIATNVFDTSNQSGGNFREIKGSLSITETKRFFEFMYLENSKTGKPFLPKEKVKELLKHGFSIPEDTENLERFTLNMTYHEFKVIYGCFFELWQAHSFVKNSGKADYAKFLKLYFTNFDKTLEATIQNSLQPIPSAKMPFEIKKYLPKNR